MQYQMVRKLDNLVHFKLRCVLDGAKSRRASVRVSAEPKVAWRSKEAMVVREFYFSESNVML